MSFRHWSPDFLVQSKWLTQKLLFKVDLLFILMIDRMTIKSIFCAINTIMITITNIARTTMCLNIATSSYTSTKWWTIATLHILMRARFTNNTIPIRSFQSKHLTLLAISFSLADNAVWVTMYSSSWIIVTRRKNCTYSKQHGINSKYLKFHISTP